MQYLFHPSVAQYSTVSAADFVSRILGPLPESARPLQCTQMAGDVVYVSILEGLHKRFGDMGCRHANQSARRCSLTGVCSLLACATTIEL